MSRAVSSHSKRAAAKPRRATPRAQTGEERRITTSEELSAALRSVWGGSGAVTSETAMRVAAVYACVRVLAESVAMLPLRLYNETTSTSTVAAGDAFDTLVYRRPNPVHTPFDFKRMLVTSLLLRGNFYAWKFMVGTRQQMLVPLHPDRVLVEVDEDNMALSYRYRTRTGGERRFRSAELVHLRGMTTDGFVGMSVISAAARAIGLSISAETHGDKLVANGASPSGILKHPQQISAEAAKRLRESFEERFAGPQNAGRTLLLEEGMSWERVGMTSEEAQFIDNRKFQRSEIAMFFGVPPHMIGDIERGTSWGSGIEQQGIGFVTYTLLPWLTNIAQGLERDLLPEDRQVGQSFRFETDELVRADFGARQTGREIQLRNGVISPDEWRRFERMNPRPDGRGGEYRGAASADTQQRAA